MKFKKFGALMMTTAVAVGAMAGCGSNTAADTTSVSTANNESNQQ